MADEFDVSRQSKNYSNNKDDWNYFMSSYLGGKKYRTKTTYMNQFMLYQHTREDNEAYKNRKDKSYYLNYCEFVVNMYSKFIFSGQESIKRVTNPETDAFDIYIENIDGKNTKMNPFMQKLLVHSIIYGESYVFVDKPQKPEGELSEMDAKKIGFRAYAKLLSPLEVLDYSINKFGLFNWVLIEERITENDDPFVKEEDIIQYRLITIVDGKVKHFVYDEQGKLKEEISTNLETIPVLKCVLTDVDQNGVGESLLKDIAKINQTIFNISSLQYQNIIETSFPCPYGPPIKDDKDLLRGTNQYITVPNGGLVPGFISPVGTSFEVNKEYVNDLISEILRLGGLQKDDGVSSSGVASGISKAISFLDTNQSFAEKASKTEQVENNIWELIRNYDTIEPGITASYPQEFDVISTSEKIKHLLDVLDSSKSSIADKILILASIKEVIKLSDEDEAAIIKELEESPEDGVVDVDQDVDEDVTSPSSI